MAVEIEAHITEYLSSQRDELEAVALSVKRAQKPFSRVSKIALHNEWHHGCSCSLSETIAPTFGPLLIHKDAKAPVYHE